MGSGMGVLELVAGAMLSAAPPPPGIALPVRAEGTVRAATVSGTGRDRYVLDVADTGTVLISVRPIAGPPPKGVLRTADGRFIRRTNRRGETWSRPPARSRLVFEVVSSSKEASTYLLSVAIDVDRPPAERHQRRPARPCDVIGLPEAHDLLQIDHVTVDDIVADAVVAKGELYVTVPAYAHAGDLRVVYADGRPSLPIPLKMIGAEPAAARSDVPVPPGACAGDCLELHVSPRMGTVWLGALARSLHADVVGHDVRAGLVTLKLQLPSSARFTLALLGSTPGVLSARIVDAVER